MSGDFDPIDPSSGVRARRPVASPAARGPAHDAFIERAATELTETYPDRAAARTRRELTALIERGRERARGYGFDEEEHVLKFLHCVLLLDNELEKPTNPDVAYVLDTLTVPNKPADRRIDRALSIAKKVAARKPVAGAPTTSSPAPAARPPTPRPSGSRIASAPPAVEQVTEPMAEPMPDLAPVAAAPPPSRRSPSGSSKPPAATTMDEGAKSTRSEPPPPIEHWKAQPTEQFPELEGFQILEKLAAGGMGTVYRAQDLQLDIEVAIKVSRSMHPAAQQQFLIEARAAAKLQHPHIVPVLRFEQYGQGGYCVMQLVKGQDAQRLIKLFGENTAHEMTGEQLIDLSGIDRASMTPELRHLVRGPQPYYRMVAFWLVGVAEGLDRAHSEGIVHYDVKPSNMILSHDGRMMLGDFGLATLVGQQAAQNATYVGTPAYLAPEMVAAWAGRSGTSETDGRVDIWGLGCTLYEALAYKPAFDGTVQRVLRAIATTTPMPPRDAVWHIPPDLEQICLKALARNPDDRYARAREMADALRNFLTGQSSGEGSKSKFSSWLRRSKPKG